MTETAAGDPLRGTLDLMIFSILAERPDYGYRIQQRLAEASRGMVELKAGTLYPLLHRMEAEKWIRGRWDDSTGRRRKFYELTAAGRRRLRQQASQWTQFAECVQRLLTPVLDQPAPASEAS